MDTEFEDRLDQFLVNKAMWECAERYSSDAIARTKILNAISKTDLAMLEEAMIKEGIKLPTKLDASHALFVMTSLFREERLHHAQGSTWKAAGNATAHRSTL